MCKRQYAVPEMLPEIRMVFRCIEKKRGTGIEKGQSLKRAWNGAFRSRQKVYY